MQSKKDVMQIEYKINEPIDVQSFYDLLINSTLGERRPINDLACLQGMLSNSNLIVSAWDAEKLVGLARSITDFHYACYLSDLAVDQAYQHQGIGKQLQNLTQAQLNHRCKLILISAPAANEYYEKIGFTHNPRCWVLERTTTL
ncbi:GNAT family N-acetyltransferase [Algibacillus agarilyticus]|uniref:GNAT family N-acetyltransferase n=1 Tax=Algibacillus agarilyticus TaxID=2234133 RepID=UPI001E3015B3|nr:GNAT family N-acetyltransferase [Algibacillus agarilyticus]